MKTDGIWLCLSLALPALAAEWERPLALRDVPPPLAGAAGHSTVLEYPVQRINSDESGWLQNEEQCVILPGAPAQRVAAWRDFRLGYRQIGLGTSTDGGASWNDRLLEPELQLYPWQSDPGLTWNSAGAVFLVLIDYLPDGPNALVVHRSQDGGQTFTRQGLASDQPTGEIFEDKELIACDRSGSPWEGALHMVWTRFDYTQGTQTRIHHCRSLDQGATWSVPQPISGTGVQWPVPVVGAAGELYAAWLSWSRGGIEFSRSLDGGLTFSPAALLFNTNLFSEELNGQVLTFAYPALDADLSGGGHHGRLHLLHADRQGADLDLFYSHSDDQGASWSPPLRFNGDAPDNGADQFHPWITVDEQGRVHALWYDRRHDLPGNLLIDVYYRMSPDGGESWLEEQRITTESFDPGAGSARAGLLGEYLGLAASQGQVQLVYTDTHLGDQDVWGCAFPALPDPCQADLPVVHGIELRQGPPRVRLLVSGGTAGMTYGLYAAGSLDGPYALVASVEVGSGVQAIEGLLPLPFPSQGFYQVREICPAVPR